MATGVVKFFNTEKGYGFIASDTGGSDTFVHITALRNAGITELREGQRVSFVVAPNRRTGKMAAANVKVM